MYLNVLRAIKWLIMYVYMSNALRDIEGNKNCILYRLNALRAIEGIKNVM